ncbi:putative uncharacterized protein [Staphylococcus sp. CAG:324]|jgi:hypothetical protein|nr:hypothetical protein [Bacilli bacterium]MBS6562977.1 hypothetical protein [Staphylococcus sp.]CDC68961.1 putative uncharacterized protein [Staphylococcus sp. CAG:324]
MRRNLKVQVTKGGITSGDVVIKTIDANDENVKKLFGELRRMTIIIPSGTIDKVIITEEKEGEEDGEESCDTVG